MLKYKTIAVDFDETLGHSTKKDYPKITKLYKYPIEVLKEYKEHGGVCILWTCRSGSHLDYAVNALKEAGLEFDAINSNTDSAIKSWLERFPDSSIAPKVCADFYIDNRSLFGYPQKLDWGAIRKTILTEE